MKSDLLPGEYAMIPALKGLNPKLMIDVGSSFGEYTQRLEEFFPEAEIHSFDPQNDTPAIGAEDGELEFRIFPYCPKRSTGTRGYVEKIEGISVTRTVPVRRLDSLFPGRQIDFLKMDIEGMEWEALQGLGDLRPTMIQFEYGYANEMMGRPLTHFGEFFYNWGYIIQQIDWSCNWGNWIAGTPETLLKVLMPTCTT